MGILNVPTKPGGALDELWLWFMRLVQQLDPIIGSTINQVTIAASETPVAHGKSYIPSAGLAIPRTNVAVWQSKQPDAKCCYFTAAAPVVCDVKVFR